jgi:hypothetical protein
MGNVFAEESERGKSHQHGAHGKKSEGRLSEGGKENVEIDNYLSADEQKRLHEIYSQIYNGGSSKKVAEVSNKAVEFCTYGNKTIIDQIITYLDIAKLSSWEAFERFIIDCSRIGSLKSLEMMFLIVSANSSSGIDEKIGAFARMALYLSNNHLPEGSEVEASVSQLQNFYKTMLHAAAPHYESKFVTEELVGVVNAYSPQLARAFQTYIILNFLNVQKESSFKLFRFPVLTAESEIASPQMLSLLSLANEDLQGEWRRLFSSNKDGRSFDRIMFSVLGFEVFGFTLNFISLVTLNYLYSSGSNMFPYSLFR